MSKKFDTADFLAGLKAEKEAKKAIAEFLAMRNVEDVSGADQYQKKGCDYLLHASASKAVKLEAKFENQKTGNVALEIISVDRPTITPGWMFTSETAFLLSVFTPSRDVFITHMDSLRLWFRENFKQYATTSKINKRGTGKDAPRIYTSYSLIPPMSVVLKEVPHTCWFNLCDHFDIEADIPSLLRKTGVEPITPEALMALFANGPALSAPAQFKADVWAAHAKGKDIKYRGANPDDKAFLDAFDLSKTHGIVVPARSGAEVWTPILMAA
jgi:hypothetical protein